MSKASICSYGKLGFTSVRAVPGETLASWSNGSEGEFGKDRVNRTQINYPLQVRAGVWKEGCKGGQVKLGSRRKSG